MRPSVISIFGWVFFAADLLVGDGPISNLRICSGCCCSCLTDYFWYMAELAIVAGVIVADIIVLLAAI